MGTRLTRRARSILLTPGLLLLALAACDSVNAVLSPGRYTYAASHPTPGGEDTIRLSGVLQVDAATADDVEGHWEVQQLHPELGLLVDEAGDRALIAHPTYFGTIYHRFSRVGSGLGCTGEYVWVAEGGVEESMPLTCSVTPAD